MSPPRTGEADLLLLPDFPGPPRMAGFGTVATRCSAAVLLSVGFDPKLLPETRFVAPAALGEAEAMRLLVVLPEVTLAGDATIIEEFGVTDAATAAPAPNDDVVDPI